MDREDRALGGGGGGVGEGAGGGVGGGGGVRIISPSMGGYDRSKQWLFLLNHNLRLKFVKRLYRKSRGEYNKEAEWAG